MNEGEAGCAFRTVWATIWAAVWGSTSQDAGQVRQKAYSFQWLELPFFSFWMWQPWDWQALEFSFLFPCWHQGGTMAPEPYNLFISTSEMWERHTKNNIRYLWCYNTFLSLFLADSYSFYADHHWPVASHLFPRRLWVKAYLAEDIPCPSVLGKCWPQPTKLIYVVQCRILLIF